MSTPRACDKPEGSPRRIQRRRTKGWRMPEGAVYVGRPSRWGNPTAVVQVGPSWECVSSELRWRCDDRAGAIRQAVNWFGYAVREGREGHPTPGEIRAELAGRDLACWCPLDQPCHADVLLRVANGGDL